MLFDISHKPNTMLPKQYRLNRGKSFDLIFRKGKKRSFNSWFNIRYLSSAKPHPRIAILIKKSSIKLATSRNRIKRKAIGLIEEKIEKSSRNLDLVIIVYQEPKNPNNWEFFQNSISEVLK